MRALARSEVVASPIRRVRQDYRASGVDGWLDSCFTYFTLESGVSFGIPASDAEYVLAAEVGSTARDFPHSSDHPLIGHRVIEVYRRHVDGEEDLESAVLELSSGVLVTQTIMAPGGTGAAGLYVYSRSEWAVMVADPEDACELVPFWAPRSSTR